MSLAQNSIENLRVRKEKSILFVCVRTQHLAIRPVKNVCIPNNFFLLVQCESIVTKNSVASRSICTPNRPEILIMFKHTVFLEGGIVMNAVV
jgi:hypothetical protein